MKRPTWRQVLNRLHQHTQTKRTAHPPTLSEPAHAQPVERAENYPIGPFGPEQGLTPAQAWGPISF
jgi:hypothetical protein